MLLLFVVGAIGRQTLLLFRVWVILQEAIVLVTHYCNVGAGTGDSSGLSMGLALLKYLAKAKWLAKDVILLAADGKAMARLLCFMSKALGTEARLFARRCAGWQ